MRNFTTVLFIAVLFFSTLAALSAVAEPAAPQHLAPGTYKCAYLPMVGAHDGGLARLTVNDEPAAHELCNEQIADGELPTPIPSATPPGDETHWPDCVCTFYTYVDGEQFCMGWLCPECTDEPDYVCQEACRWEPEYGFWYDCELNYDD